MKLDEIMCLNEFEKLTIDEKRWLVAIITEYKAAQRKHPKWPGDHIHAAAIVIEESGELMQAALQHTYEKGRYYQIHKEAIQTGATCLRLLINMPELKLPD